MTEYIYRKGYEIRHTGYIPKWYEWILFYWIIDVMLFYKKEFVDFINDKGKIRRVYPE